MTEELNFPNRVNRGAGDEVLRLLAHITRANLSMSIILVMPGGVLTGTLISRDQWYEEWLAEIKASGLGGEVLSNAIRKVTSEAGMYVLDNELPAKDRPSIVHLKDAHIHSGDRVEGPCLWRVRVDAISAWSLGKPRPGGS